MTLALSGPIVLVGAGNMGGALALGWVKSGIEPASIIGFVSAAPEKVTASVLFLAVKPQVMADVLPAYRMLIGPETIVCQSRLARPSASSPSILAMPPWCAPCPTRRR